MTRTKTVLSAMIRPLVEQRLPDSVEPYWFTSREEALELAPLAEIGWFDMYDKKDMAAAITAAENIQWLNSIYAGVDGMPLDLLKQRGAVVTNGVGINAVTIAEYVVMGMLTMAKGYDDVVRARDRKEWLQDSPGKFELMGSRALLLGAGAIGGLVKERLAAFGVEVTTVRRTPQAADEMGPDEWRSRLVEYDWIVLAVPATPETERMIGSNEFAAMKPSARVVNIARGSVIDQPALVEALQNKEIAGAFLDVTDPEPLPADNPLWDMPNAHITMHLSGRAQDKMFVRSADRFLENLDLYLAGKPVSPRVDLDHGY